MNRRSWVMIELAGLSRTYPGPPPVGALLPTHLTVTAGEHIAVIGRSGSGKSTLLNLLGLLDRPSSGAYRFDGVRTSELSDTERTTLRGRRIGFVFQGFNLLAHRTATENVALGRLYSGVGRRERIRDAREALMRVGLGHRLDAMPPTMSGGERQRVAIARAIVNRPRLLLCDEPTGNLDSATAGEVLDVLEQLHGDGVTLIVITHDPDTAVRAQRVLLIRDGHVSEAAPMPSTGHV
jgi:putative ABC transport system ATP-binding protein